MFYDATPSESFVTAIQIVSGGGGGGLGADTMETTTSLYNEAATISFVKSCSALNHEYLRSYLSIDAFRL